MKKIITCLVLSLFCVKGFSQTEAATADIKKNEIKVNALLLVLGSFEVSYERILNDESAIGVSLNVPFDNENWDINYAATGYYRYYFGKKPATGFFGEAFGMLNNVDEYVYEENETEFSYESKTLTDFALGIGLGGKWVTKKGLLFEINAGVGRNLFNNQYDDRDYELIGRAGITVGYRF